MSRKGPEVGQGMLDFVEDLRYDDIIQVDVHETVIIELAGW